MSALRDDGLRPAASWRRIAALSFALLAAVLLPFALWGDALEQAAPGWLQAQDGRAWLATIGIALLVIDVLLPVPSSVIAVALCWSLGPVAGGAAVAVGAFLAFVAGYGLGRLLPEPRLRRWIGPALWDRVRGGADRSTGWWIVLARPLPVLAELSAVLAGVWRLPMRRAFAQAALASIAMGALYGGSAWLGARAPGAATLALALLALPAAFWCAHRVWLRRLGAKVPSSLAADATRDAGSERAGAERASADRASAEHAGTGASSGERG
jgi:uncharacterized membrane protein YdjX (TVP38/TMEM64 family)